MKARTTEHILDEALVLACQGNDESAYVPLVRRWHPKLTRYLARLTGQAGAADDLAQEVWLSVVRELPRLNDPAAFPGWLYRIAHRRAVDWVRQQQRRRKADQAHYQTARESAQSRLDVSHESEELWRAMDALTIEHRSTAVLYYLEDFSVSEIAETLAVPIGTIKSRLHHARQQLRATLEKKGL